MPLIPRRSRKPKVAGRDAAHVPAVNSSYIAQGIAAPPTIDQELGSNKPTVFPEIVPELASPYVRSQTYARMMNDMGVDVSIRVVKTPALGSDVFVEPASNQQQDIDIAEFVSANLFSAVNSPFLSTLEDILSFFEDGYSVLEKVYTNRMWTPSRQGGNGKQYTMLKELAYRPATSIKDVQFDNNGHPIKITQSAIQADGSVVDKDIDITKCLIFTHGRKGGDIRGKSLLRTAHPHWFYKTHMYKIDAIQKERHALGVPKGKLLPGYTSEDKRVARNLLRNISANEESFMLLTPTVDVEFAEMKGHLVNVLESADHHNIMILMNVMGQFLALGVEGHGGGRATGGAQTDIFMKSLRYIMNLVCDIINMYLIPELVVYNFPTNNFPKLQVRNIGETRDLQMLGSALANMVTAGGLTMDIETENWFRRVFDIPPKNADAQVLPGHDKTTAPTPVDAVSQKGAVKPGSNGKGSGNVGVPDNAPQ